MWRVSNGDDWWNQAVLEEFQVDGADWPPDLSTWWTPPAFESLHAAPELQEVVGAHFLDAGPVEQRPPSRACRNHAKRR